MKCVLCGKKTGKIMKVVDGVGIYECAGCRLGFVDQSEKNGKDPKHLYSYKAYKKNDQMIRKRLESLTDRIVAARRSGNILEIGAGYGLAGSMLLKKGKYKLDIVEPYLTPKYLLKEKYELHKGDLDGFLKGNTKKYDIVIMLDVIEHLKDPFKSLLQLKNLLNKEGILIVQTPNYRSLMQKIVKNWSWWMVEDHKWFFSPKSLRGALEEKNFKPIFTSSYEDWIDLKKNLDGNFRHMRPVILRRFAKALFFMFFFPLYWLFRPLIWKMEYGGLLFYIAKKN